jgi:hypothetical protein
MLSCPSGWYSGQLIGAIPDRYPVTSIDLLTAPAAGSDVAGGLEIVALWKTLKC